MVLQKLCARKTGSDQVSIALAHASINHLAGWHRWGIQTPNGAGCHSAVGIMTKEYPLLGRIGLDFEHSWGMAMSPGPEKPKGPHRIEMPGRLDRDEVAVVEVNLDEGWMRITVDGLERAYWNDLGIIKQNVKPPLLSITLELT